jgi:NADPH:quinone reductase-like Zn-dependent oxidoreductase
VITDWLDEQIVMADMKAIRIHNYGGPEVLAYEDAPRPTPAADEILLRVKASGVNPIDWKIREGQTRGWLNHTLPLILGGEAAGVVEEVGVGITRFKPGDEVYAYPSLARCGAYAEFVTVKETEAALKPKTLDFVNSAALVVGALTAWQALEMAGLSAGQTVLIHAAAGGVGSLGVQLAKICGARVIGTASAANADFLREIGCDEAIDYRATRFEEAAKDADAVFDLIGGETLERSFGVLKRGGALISAVQPPDAERAAQLGVKAAMVIVNADAGQLAQFAVWADEGRLKPIVSTVLPLSEARRAQELSQAGRTRGKIILTPEAV